MFTFFEFELEFPTISVLNFETACYRPLFSTDQLYVKYCFLFYRFSSLLQDGISTFTITIPSDNRIVSENFYTISNLQSYSPLNLLFFL